MAFNLTIDNPLGFIADIKKNTKLFGWVSLIFQMSFSGFVTFCGVTGYHLAISKDAPLVAVGFGLISTSTVLAIFFGASPLTRGMMMVRPQELANESNQTNINITSK